MALPGMTTTMTGGPLGSLRWMSPELIESEAEANEATDIWAFAMTILVGFSELNRSISNTNRLYAGNSIRKTALF